MGFVLEQLRELGYNLYFEVYSQSENISAKILFKVGKWYVLDYNFAFDFLKDYGKVKTLEFCLNEIKIAKETIENKNYIVKTLEGIELEKFRANKEKWFN